MVKIIDDDAALGEQSSMLKTPISDDPITVSEVEQLARMRLPKAVYDYYSSGTDDQYALRRNVDSFSR
jgi:(S)-2-hydroxy-acid oxidase